MNLPAMANAETVPVHGVTVLGHDLNGWAVAMICALVAAFIYEAVMALMRKVTRRIPFLLLKVARRSIREDLRDDVYDMWGAELTDILTNQGKGPVPGLLRGTGFALGLALFGARRLMEAKVEAEVAAAVRMKEAEEVEMSMEERALARFSPEQREKFVQTVVRLLRAVASFVRAHADAVAMTAAAVTSLAAAIARATEMDALASQLVVSAAAAIAVMVKVAEMFAFDAKSER